MGFPGDAVVNNPPVSAGDLKTGIHPLSQEDPLEKEMATSLAGYGVHRVAESMHICMHVLPYILTASDFLLMTFSLLNFAKYMF